jgi:hypothetical protein
MDPSPAPAHAVLMPAQRFPERASHGAADSDAAGTETNVDLNAALYYHRVGTPQGSILAGVEAALTNEHSGGRVDQEGR